ncbi:cytidylyltransferase domain-containing protein [Pseudoalteromonas xiamenensis]|uniref:Glycosyltransferase family protein n=1 Tax=Pseudoalteromonas xiamenensis TaxID=882626 RepID=A0A975HKL7_9GAMM|nr:glycosyltransferase family protein [Pseudoalteromonas xiamenensis]QTH71052.1 glycosyltransferase family protein [Pseudoalteromonas xiamenensis]
MANLQIIIQARMTSTRLPGKVMLPLLDVTVLEVMINRLKDLASHVIIATTNDGSEQPIVNLCQRLNIRFYQGSTDDVLSRYFEAATHFGADDETIILRLTSDCPLIDYDLTQDVIKKLEQTTVDMASVGPHSGFPRGLDCCGFRYPSLKRTHEVAQHPADREHVTLGMSKFQDMVCYNISAEEDLSHYRLTLDEPADYDAINAVYTKMGNHTNFSYQDLVNTLKKNPELYDINKHVEQKSV